MVMKEDSLVPDSGKPDYDDQTLDEDQIDYHDPDQLDQHQQLPSLILSSSTSGDPNGAIVINGKQMDLSSERYAVLSYEQVLRLDNVMDEVVPIHGRGNFPTLEMKLKDLVSVVRGKLEEESVTLRDIRLNGGAASYVLCPNNLTYNDLDLIFVVDLSTSRNFDKVRSAVLDSLLDFLPEGVNKKRISSCSLKEAYVHKMVKVNEGGDRWSLISLSNNRGRNVELKFVDSMRRQFEFSVDSFQIILDSLLSFYEVDPPMRMSENFYPTVVGESVYGDFREALFHLNKRLIATRNPEEIRGGGLLKYCNLLVRKYRRLDEIKNLERYMCSRFFIDFSDLCQQRKKLESYIANHFVGDDQMKYEYLMTLFNVVDESTVCLMGHERRQTLHLIQELAYHYYYQDQQKLMLKQQFDAAAAAATAAAAAASSTSTSSTSSSSPLSTSTYTSLPSSSSSATSVSNSCSSTAVSLSPCSSPSSSSSSTCSISSSSSTSSLSSCTSSAAAAAHAAAAAAAAAHSHQSHYYYGNSAQIYYSPYHSYNCNHQPNCFNPCHCGGWMTCA